MDKIPKKALMTKEYIKEMDENLKETARLLKGFNWTINGGTLLGKIRHNDYVPWDDDIDIKLSIPKNKVKILTDKLDKEGTRYRKSTFGLQLFGKRPYVDIFLLDDNFKFHNPKISKQMGEVEPTMIKNKIVKGKFRGIPIRMPTKKASIEYLDAQYNKRGSPDWRTTGVVWNHKFKPKPKLIVELPKKKGL